MTVSLRALDDSDLDRMYAWESDPVAAELAAFVRQDPTDRSAFDAHYRSVRSNPANTLLAIEDDGELVGTIGSFTVEGDRELTYWVDRACWGRGIASAAVRVFLGVEHQRPLHGRAAAHNLGSRRVLERAGFVEVAEEVSWAVYLGRNVTELVYRLD